MIKFIRKSKTNKNNPNLLKLKFLPYLIHGRHIFATNLMNMINEGDIHPIHSVFSITTNERESDSFDI